MSEICTIYVINVHANTEGTGTPGENILNAPHSNKVKRYLSVRLRYFLSDRNCESA